MAAAHGDLEQYAQKLAKSRGETVCTLHVLAALSESPTAAGGWLRERNIRPELVLSAVRVLEEPKNAPGLSAVTKLPREFDAERRAATVLVALCKHRESAAYRFFSQCGTDIARLRARAASVANGAVASRGTPVASAPARVTPAPLRGVLSTQVVAPKPTAATTKPLARPASARSESSPPSSRTTKKDAPRSLKFSFGESAQAVMARAGQVVGRETEVEEISDALTRMDTRVVCVHGEPGVGKTRVLHAVLAELQTEEPQRPLYWADASALLAGAVGRGQVAERLVKVEAEARKAGAKPVVFLDQADALMASDDEASAALRASAAAGEVRWVLGLGDAARSAWMNREPSAVAWCADVRVLRLGMPEARAVIAAHLPRYAAHHEVLYPEGIESRLVAWTARYLGDAPQPGPALEALDLAGARAHRTKSSQVMAADVARIVSRKCAVPVERLLEADDARMARLGEALAERVVGHRESLARIARVVRRRASGFGGSRPVGSFLLLGPTGVGKTETAKALAHALFDSESAMTRFDMSEFSESHAVARLIGAPPGYVGHEGGGQLTESLRKRPYQVVLFDEIEKAHPDVLLALLQVLDEGRMTDGRGRTVDMRQAVFVLTSNLGSSVYSAKKSRKVGFGAESDIAEGRVAAVTAAAKEALAPEFYNRLDEVLVYEPLSRDEVSQIARALVKKLSEELLLSKGVALVVSDEALEKILDDGGYDVAMGARPVRRALQREVEGRAAEHIVGGTAKRGDTVRIERHGAELVATVAT